MNNVKPLVSSNPDDKPLYLLRDDNPEWVIGFAEWVNSLEPRDQPNKLDFRDRLLILQLYGVFRLLTRGV